jgi:hypothetical protein
MARSDRTKIHAAAGGHKGEPAYGFVLLSGIFNVFD